MVPIEFVNEATPLRVQLFITREQFMELPEYQTDPSIAEAVDRALWNDVVLRHTDYYGIDVQVRDGVVLPPESWPDPKYVDIWQQKGWLRTMDANNIEEER